VDINSTIFDKLKFKKKQIYNKFVQMKNMDANNFGHLFNTPMVPKKRVTDFDKIDPSLPILSPNTVQNKI
jgi:hypothetical protein